MAYGIDSIFGLVQPVKRLARAEASTRSVLRSSNDDFAKFDATPATRVVLDYY